MTEALILASKSRIRSEMLVNANVSHRVVAPRVDEDAIKTALVSENVGPRNVADALAEAKARKISGREQGLVLGCDQVLVIAQHILSKPVTKEDSRGQLQRLRGRLHHLYSAAVIYDDGRPVWRHIGHVRLTMRDATDAYIDDYVERNWDRIRHSVGSYNLEEEGVRLFERIEGDYFNVLGLPLLELLSYLTVRGTLQG